MRLVLKDAEARHYLAGLELEKKLDAVLDALVLTEVRLTHLEDNVSEIKDQLLGQLATAAADLNAARAAFEANVAAENAEDVVQEADKVAAVAAKQIEIDAAVARIAELEAQLAGGVPAEEVPAITTEIAALVAQAAALRAEIENPPVI